MATAAKSFDSHLRQVSAAVRPTLEAARRLVSSAAPKAVEVPYQSRRPASPSAMWKLARYTVDGGNVVGIGTFARHASLYFYRGRELDDGSGLLKGRGKEMRSVTVRAPADLERAEVKRVVRQAFKLGGVKPTAKS